MSSFSSDCKVSSWLNLYCEHLKSSPVGKSSTEFPLAPSLDVLFTSTNPWFDFLGTIFHGVASCLMISESELFMMILDLSEGGTYTLSFPFVVCISSLSMLRKVIPVSL